jgi:hypothetical protein
MIYGTHRPEGFLNKTSLSSYNLTCTDLPSKSWHHTPGQVCARCTLATGASVVECRDVLPQADK